MIPRHSLKLLAGRLRANAVFNFWKYELSVMWNHLVDVVILSNWQRMFFHLLWLQAQAKSVCERTGSFQQSTCRAAKHINFSHLKTVCVQELFSYLSEKLHHSLPSSLERKCSSSGKMPVKLFHISNSTLAYSLFITTTQHGFEKWSFFNSVVSFPLWNCLDEMNGWQSVSTYSPVVNANSESIEEHVQIFSV